jgi:CRP-like cAMP-binding protein
VGLIGCVLQNIDFTKAKKYILQLTLYDGDRGSSHPPTPVPSLINLLLTQNQIALPNGLKRRSTTQIRPQFRKQIYIEAGGSFQN